MSNARLPVFERFIADLRGLWAAEPDDGRRMEKSKPLLEAFVTNPSIKAHSAQWPPTEGRKNLLLYVDPTYGFVINGVVRVPGRTGSVHDHADAWVLYGVLDGSETLERYERIDDGSRPGYAEVRLACVTTGTQGKVDLVPPHAIHAEQGGPVRSVAVILRSKGLGEGKLLQRMYDPEAKTVVERYGPTQIPLKNGNSANSNKDRDQVARCRIIGLEGQRLAGLFYAIIGARRMAGVDEQHVSGLPTRSP